MASLKLVPVLESEGINPLTLLMFLNSKVEAWKIIDRLGLYQPDDKLRMEDEEEREIVIKLYSALKKEVQHG